MYHGIWYIVPFFKPLPPKRESITIVSASIRFRLAVMMFLQFFIAGAFTPVLSLYLRDVLHFSGMQVGIILSVTAGGSIAAPLLASFIADRFIRAERLLGILQLAGGALMLVFALERRFWPVVILYLGYTIVTVPTFALTNAIIFHHATGARHTFGSIRVYGTIGWIAVAWLFSYFWVRSGGNGIAASRLPDALILAAITSFALGIYSFMLPSSGERPRASGRMPILPFTVLKNPAVLRLCTFMFLLSFFYRFYFFGTAPFLHAIGFADRNIMPAMSLGQVPEVFAMGLLGWLLLRYGMRKIIVIGILLDIFRYVTAALSGPPWLVLLGLSVHGLSYTFIYASGSIYLDRFCDEKTRSGVHQIFAMITSGLGNFTGYLFCGFIMDLFTGPGSRVNYHLFWLTPAVGIAILLCAVPVWLRISRKGDMDKGPEGVEMIDGEPM